MKPWTGPAAALADRILAFVDASLDRREPSESFEAIALDLHRWQRAHDPVLAALSSGDPQDWREIPAIPVALFKEFPIGTVGPHQAPHTFRTSGTTGGGRGEHHLRSTSIYDHGALGFARQALRERHPLPRRIVSLLEDPALTPESSLAHMVALFTAFDQASPGTASWHVRQGVVDRAGINDRLANLDEPVFLASTAFALADWLDGEVIQLPPGSWLMVTGGFKGRRVRVDDAGLYREAERRLAPAAIATEYGMTELSSQLWGEPGRPFRAPPWLRAVAVDPATGTPLPAETVGQLRFYDLCNLDSTIGIETMDEGVVHADGSVTLHGRLVGAEARGCSLTVEEAWERRRALDSQ
jgi:hypothetical protein